MKNTFKFLGIITLVVVIGFTACSTEEVTIDPCCDGKFISSEVTITGLDSDYNTKYLVLALARGGEIKGITFEDIVDGQAKDMGMLCAGCMFPVSLIGGYMPVIMIYEDSNMTGQPLWSSQKASRNFEQKTTVAW